MVGPTDGTFDTTLFVPLGHVGTGEHIAGVVI